MAKKTLGVNPWIEIWSRPRKTIQKIVNYNPRHRFLFLSFIYGLPMLFHLAQNYSLAESFTTVGIVIAGVVLAIFVGMLAITIAAALLQWTGKWIGGKASFIKVRAAVTWSNVPSVIAIIVWAALIYFFRDEVFMEDFTELQYSGQYLYFAAGGFFIQGVLAVWSFIILVKGLAQVNGFSAWKGVLNVFIPFTFVGIFIWLVTWIIWLFSGMI